MESPAGVTRPSDRHVSYFPHRSHSEHSSSNRSTGSGRKIKTLKQGLKGLLALLSSGNQDKRKQGAFAPGDTNQSRTAPDEYLSGSVPVTSRLKYRALPLCKH